MVKRLEEGAEAGYVDFKANEDFLSTLPIKSMSAVTNALLCNINYEEVIRIRRRNFLHLHRLIGKSNILKISEDFNFVPMVYPFLPEKPGLREYLISHKIYVAKYWPNVQEWLTNDALEYFITSNLVPLPVDQRYNLKDIKRVAAKVLNYV